MTKNNNNIVLPSWHPSRIRNRKFALGLRGIDIKAEKAAWELDPGLAFYEEGTSH